MKTIKVIWKDAVSYRSGTIVPKEVSLFETTGIFEKEENGFILLRNPITINKKTFELHPKGLAPKYYCIPKKTIVSFEEIIRVDKNQP